MNQDISLYIVKPFTEVSALQRLQWVSQVFALALTLYFYVRNQWYQYTACAPTVIGPSPSLAVRHCLGRSRHEVLALVQARGGAPRPKA